MRLRSLALSLSVLAALALAPPGASAFTLDEVVVDVETDYPDVKHLTSEALSKSMAGKDLLLLDVREADEFAVSHLPGAVRVPPDTDWADLATQLTDKIRGRKVIVYCSVGVRSSQLAADVQGELMSRGAKSVHNLSGGIFRWHNEQRLLVNQGGGTDYIHPYNWRWGKLINRSGQTSYKPKN